MLWTRRRIEVLFYFFVFLARMAISVVEPQRYNYCGTLCYHIFQFTAIFVIIFAVWIPFHFFVLRLVLRQIAMEMYAEWWSRFKFGIYLLFCSIPSCFLSQWMLWIWRY